MSGGRGTRAEWLDLVDQLVERRARLGISYVMIHDRAMDAFAPVVAQLAGR